MNRVGDSPVITIQAAILNFIDHTNHTDSAPTAAINNQALKLFSRFLHENTPVNPFTDTLEALSANAFKTFLDYLQTTYSAETEHAYFRAVTSFTAALADATDIAPNLSVALSELTVSRRKKHKQQPHIPHDRIHEIRQYLEALPAPDAGPDTPEMRERYRILRDKALILTMLDTGLKASEITSLRANQLDIATKTLTLDSTVLPLSPSALNAIRQYLRERSSLDQQQREIPISSLPLFARHDKRASTRVLPISRWTVGNIVTYWTLVATENSAVTDQTITPSILRHHFVDATLSATNDLTLTQHLARHKDKGTTRHYLQPHPKPDAE